MAHILGQGTPADPKCLLLTTRKNRLQIPNEVKDEFSPGFAQKLSRDFRLQFPDVKPRSLSGTYNCVGHVFGSRRTWIDTNQIELILAEDGYQKLGPNEVPIEGDLILYSKEKRYSHIGVVQKVSPDLSGGNRHKITILSKWGDLCEALHEIEEYGYDFYNYEFWSERKNK